jgi:hypothetical protein
MDDHLAAIHELGIRPARALVAFLVLDQIVQRQNVDSVAH